MNNTITEMKATLEGISSRITEAKERVSDLEDRRVEFTATEQNKEKRMKRNEDSLRDLWDNVEYTHIHIIGVQEGEEIEKGPKKVFEEIIVKNVPKVSQDKGLANLGCPNHPEKLAGKRQLNAFHFRNPFPGTTNPRSHCGHPHPIITLRGW